MDAQILTKTFERIGARLKIADQPRRYQPWPKSLTIDINSDRRGEYFQLLPDQQGNCEVHVLDANATDRHLLLFARQEGIKSKFLCGHDERHWFVAAIPESAPVGNVKQAKTALQPAEVQLEVARIGLNDRHRNRRKNGAFSRQGEWFFLPEPGAVVDRNRILRNEPLQRSGASKPHWADECIRIGGTQVYVSQLFPQGLLEEQHAKILQNVRYAGRYTNWQVRIRNPTVYVRGRIRHADHATIYLDGWHRVVMNTENQAVAMQHVVFLD